MGPATLVNAGGMHYLFDAGRNATVQLAQAGVEARELEAICITHHHFDSMKNQVLLENYYSPGDLI